MNASPTRSLTTALIAAASLVVLASCATQPETPKISTGGGKLSADHCDAMAQLVWPNTRFTSASWIAGATVTGVQSPAPPHCLLKGRLNERISSADGRSYGIGFEMRLPSDWSGRFFHQANGGIDGVVAPAFGAVGGGGPTTTALHMGFAVLSSDAGHPAPNPFFGLDPQARIDYGYGAVQGLTPAAKQIITKAYGKAPDRSYLGGCSNGGRHAMVAASRFAADCDGVLAGNPGFQLPKAAVAQLAKVQAYASVSSLSTTGLPDIQSAISPAEYKLVGQSVLSRCDALDGVVDGMVLAPQACQMVFSLARHVPSCASGDTRRDGICLSAERKLALAKVFASPVRADGKAVYAPFWFDPGVAHGNWRFWHLTASQNLDPGAVAFIFSTPPSSTAGYFASPGLRYALAANVADLANRIEATSGAFGESGMSFMSPPAAEQLRDFQLRGRRMIVYHGSADGVFSVADTADWYDKLNATHRGQAGNFARLFVVPGMNHCSGGASTDQFNMLQSLVDWVERGVAPHQVLAQVRGATANVPNAEIPKDWSPNRSRPLCPYPQVARLVNGAKDTERADAFVCGH